MSLFQLYPCNGLAQIFFIHFVTITVDNMLCCVRILRSFLPATDPLQVLEITVRNAGNIAAREDTGLKMTISTSGREFGARSHQIGKSLINDHVCTNGDSNFGRRFGVGDELIRDRKIDPVSVVISAFWFTAKRFSDEDGLDFRLCKLQQKGCQITKMVKLTHKYGYVGWEVTQMQG